MVKGLELATNDYIIKPDDQMNCWFAHILICAIRQRPKYVLTMRGIDYCLSTSILSSGLYSIRP